MKVAVINGWREAPHQWWRYLILPFGWDGVTHNGMGWVCLSAFGFAIFVYW